MAQATDFSYLSQVVLANISARQNELNFFSDPAAPGHPNGWRPVMVRDGRGAAENYGAIPVTRAKNFGFTGMAFENANEVIIAFAGTEFRLNEASAADMVGNLGLATGNGRDQLLDAALLYLQVRAAHPNKEVTFTGHSLGGGLATLMSVLFDREAVVYSPAPFKNGARIHEFDPGFPQPVTRSGVPISAGRVACRDRGGTRGQVFQRRLGEIGVLHRIRTGSGESARGIPDAHGPDQQRDRGR